MFKKIKQAIKSFRKSKMEWENVVLSPNEITPDDVEKIKKMCIDSIKTADRFVVLTVKNSDIQNPHVGIYGIPSIMLPAVLSIIVDVHKKMTGQNNAITNARKLLNLE